MGRSAQQRCEIQQLVVSSRLGTPHGVQHDKRKKYIRDIFAQAKRAFETRRQDSEEAGRQQPTKVKIPTNAAPRIRALHRMILLLVQATIIIALSY